MAGSVRYPHIELQDALRQQWYVPASVMGPNGTIIDPWMQISEDNPNWQLLKRKRYSLDWPRSGRGVPDTRSPWKPSIPELEDDQALIRPVLFDNVNELGIAAVGSPAPLTGVTVEYAGSNPVGLITNDDGQFVMVFNALLFVFNQDAVRSRLLRYLNWFQHKATLLRDGGTRPQAIESLIDIGGVGVSGPVPTSTTGPFSNIPRQASIGVVIEVKVPLLTTDPRNDVRSDQDIFDNDNTSP